MKFGIIAAGEGSRLSSEGIGSPKPLVEVGGEKLIDRLVRIFGNNGADEIDVICNGLTPLVKNHLQGMIGSGMSKLKFTVKTTPSSMHSFAELSRLIGNADMFVVTTVDTIFCEHTFADYVSAFRRDVSAGLCDGMMGVTTYIDDEKPLYVAVGKDNVIDGFHDGNSSRYVSAGIYGLTQASLTTLRRCLERGESRMRNFQRAMIADGLRLRAFDMGKVLDIDHASDIAKAEELIG